MALKLMKMLNLLLLTWTVKLGKHANVGGFYTRVNGEDLKSPASAKAYKNIYGFNTDFNFDKVWVGGEWVKASNVKDSTAWTAGVGFGNYSIAKKGSWDVKGQYFNAKEKRTCIRFHLEP